MSKLTASPPRRLSKLSEVSTPLWWKKYSLPSSAAMNPNPRSDTIFFTVPFGIAVLLLSNTEWNASALFEREECRPHARSPAVPGERLYLITLVRYGARSRAAARGRSGPGRWSLPGSGEPGPVVENRPRARPPRHRA